MDCHISDTIYQPFTTFNLLLKGIYDYTIIRYGRYNIIIKCYREEKPSLQGVLNGHRLEAHVYMERIPIEQVPEGEKECEKWMYDLFEKKVII